MSEERLQEIKDSIEFQYTLAKAKGVDNALLFTNEEEELVEEVERLKEDNKELSRLYTRANNEFLSLYSIIKEVREVIETCKEYTNMNYLLSILDKVEKVGEE